MGLELVKEVFSGRINTISIGATSKEGGTRAFSLQAGGQNGLPFLHQESEAVSRPLIAFEISDIAPDWPQFLKSAYKDALSDPVSWALMCKEEFGAKLLALRFAGAHPENGNKSIDEEVKLLRQILSKVDLPLIVIGCEDHDKDNLLFPEVSQAAKGERVILASAVQENYKTLTASALADGHYLVAESPIDVNIAKQLNILITDMGFPKERIVINPTVGALGYGLEYAYSIMERARLAAFAGDAALAMPFICFVGQEAWRVKEAKAVDQEAPDWGLQKVRAPLWEAMTAAAFLQAGADILVMRHPEAISMVELHIDSLTKKA